jgi:propanediol dehydratase small subunit
MRRDLERRSKGRVQRRRSMAVSANELESVLEELIAALDRRVPRVERAGEAGIARDAAVLRAKAVERLAELVRDRDNRPTSAANPP